jgi:hypothetical protein
MRGGDDCGATGGMDEWQGEPSTRNKTGTVPLWSSQITHISYPGFEPGSP